MALWRWYRTRNGYVFLHDHLNGNAHRLNPETRELLIHMYESESTRLLDTDPIYVSEEMCEVIEAASGSFKPEALRETDLITPRGFIYFAKPFVVPDRFDEPTTIAGCSWTRLFNANDPMTVSRAHQRMNAWKGNSIRDLEEQMLAEDPNIEPYGIALSIYADTEQYLADDRDRYINGAMPPVIPLHLTPWYFNMTFEGNEIDDGGRATGAEWWWRILQSTFRLMQQRISVKHRVTPERHTRREAKRLGARPDTEIVVVRLRREKGDAKEPTGESANYSHRFIVGGHWRNQPYTSLGIWRQIWISPYVKGDPSLPLIVRPKRVFQWDR